MQARTLSNTKQNRNHQENFFESPFGRFALRRYPKENDPNLRAWSAADEYLLHYFKEHFSQQRFDKNALLIANDNFGALTLCLHQYMPTSWSDSFIFRRALLQNTKLNNETISTFDDNCFLASTDPLPESVQVALMQLPKNHQFLRFQLEQIKNRLTPNGIVVAGVMVKHFHQNVLQHFEQIIGPTETSLAKKKARLIIARNATQTSETQDKNLKEYANVYHLNDDNHFPLVTLPNVFSFEKLDIGTRALLPYIAGDPQRESILDLGCGNGALGIQAARRNPQASIYFADESYMAVESAKLSWTSCGLSNPSHFMVTDTLLNAPKDLDLILCNPPFHQQNSVHTSIAKRMFHQAHQHLKSGGQLIVVANRHLGYHLPLKKRFATVSQLGHTTKFEVWCATKR